MFRNTPNSKLDLQFASRGQAGPWVLLVTLLASLSLAMAGMVGVAIATPAAAAQGGVPGPPSADVNSAPDSDDDEESESDEESEDEEKPKAVQAKDADEGPDIEKVCPDGDSNGATRVDGSGTSMTITAPDGFLIDWYCVKAGSSVAGTGGPEPHPVDPPQKSVTISHSTDKDISHYSFKTVAEPEPELFPYSAQKTVTKTICTSSGTNNAATATGEEFSDTKTGSDFTDEEKAAIDALAQESAEEAFDAKYQPYVEGECSETFSYYTNAVVTRTICTLNGTVENASHTGPTVGISQMYPISDLQKAMYDATALLQAESGFDTKYGPWEEGQCVYTYEKQVTVTQDICTAGGTIQGATATGVLIEETKYDLPFTQEEKDEVDKRAATDARAAFEEAFAPYTPGECTTTNSYSFSRQATVTRTICTVDGTIDGAQATGSLIAETRATPFSDAEKADIEARAQASAEAAFAAAYPGHVEGACTTTTEEPEETPVAVAPILPGTVEETPDAVAPVLPAKVPAGEESSGTNLAVALPLGVLGMLGMVIAGLAMRRGSRGSITSS